VAPLNEPSESVVVGLRITNESSNFTVIGEEEAKPVPETVTV
jgi:hypothetical protein